MVGRTEYFPAFAEALSVVGVNNVGDGVAVVVVSRPYVAYSTLTTEVVKLEDGGGKGDFASCRARQDTKRPRGYSSLFCPTVGAILSGERPGVSL